MSSGKVRMVAPIGELPKTDMDLKKSIDGLGKHPSTKAFCQAITRWEDEFVSRYRENEQTEETGTLK